MSARYLLTCPACEKRIPVEAGRAGGTATCSCGATADVPPMRVLRTLPQETTETQPAGSQAASAPSNWGQKQGLMLLGVLLILAGGIPAIYRTVTFPESPTRTQEEVQNVADVEFDKMTLTESWGFWKTFIEPQGLTREPTVYEAAYVRQAADARQWIMIFCSIAVVGALLLLLGLVIKGEKPARAPV